MLKQTTLVLCVMLTFGMNSTMAMFMQPTFMPADRLATNMEAYLAKHPRDARAYYNLGRIHFLAYSNKSQLVPGTGGKDYPRVAGDHLVRGQWLHYERDHAAREQAMQELSVTSVQELPEDELEQFYQSVGEIYQQFEQDEWVPEPVTETDLLRHATAALAAFQQAVTLEPDNGLFQLGLASLLETISASLPDNKTPNIYDQLAVEHYLKAFNSSVEADTTLEHIPLTGLRSIVSFEAGQAYLRLTINNSAESKERQSIENHIGEMSQLRRGPITPIVFALDRRSYADLESSLIAQFDLDGDGTKTAWHWLRSDVGILVWAPLETTDIRSGHQLFGPFTFNQIWSHGYAPLAALDDNQDGELRWGELAGIRAWFDRNGDGRSGEGEVVSLDSVGIQAISVRYERLPGGILHQSGGIRLRSGETRPTWDWLARPAK